VALAVAAALLLTAGISAASATATVKPTAKAAPAAVKHAAKPVLAATADASAIPTCNAGVNNDYEYYTNCTAGTYYSRTVAQCEDGNLALGAEVLGSSRVVSVSTCENEGELNSLDNWGILYCSNNSGDGTYEGYDNEKGDISQFMVTVGNGSIPTGGTYMCQVDVNASTVIADIAPS
jgi:hypothetical protein